MKDFTLKTYTELLTAIKEAGYQFQTFEQFIKEPKTKVVILRHDSDIRPKNDYKFAKIENSLGIQASYYFRIPMTFNPVVIKKINDLNHEVGYHYEDLRFTNGDLDKAFIHFSENLQKLRQVAPVSTIVMHGSPLSKWDSKLIWSKHDFTELDVIAEPYLSLDFDKVLYLTDTGRRWDGNKVSIRDEVKSKFDFDISSTLDLIKEFEKSTLPNQIMINSHAAQWYDNLLFWLYRFNLQMGKNFIKRIIKKFS